MFTGELCVWLERSRQKCGPRNAPRSMHVMYHVLIRTVLNYRVSISEEFRPDLRLPSHTISQISICGLSSDHHYRCRTV